MGHSSWNPKISGYNIKIIKQCIIIVTQPKEVFNLVQEKTCIRNNIKTFLRLRFLRILTLVLNSWNLSFLFLDTCYLKRIQKIYNNKKKRYTIMALYVLTVHVCKAIIKNF